MLLPSTGLAGNGRLTTSQYSSVVEEVGPYAGAIVERALTTDGSAHQVQRDVDPFGNVVAVKEIGTGSVTHYAYRVTGALASVTDAQGNVTAINYADFLERDRTLVDPDTGSTTFTHDPSGNLVAQRDAANVTTTWSYDALGRPLARVFGNGVGDALWSYDTAVNGAGLLARRADTSGTYHVEAYDPAGRPLSEKRVIGSTTHTFTNSFDRLGQLRSRIYPTNRRLDWIYDVRGYLSSVRDVTDSKNYATALDWDARLLLKSWTAGNNFKQNQSFETSAPATGRLNEIEIRNATAAEQRWQYDYYPDDSIESINDPSTPTKNRSFDYDGLDRMKSATVSEGAVRTYDYDTLGNVTCVEKNGASCNGAATALVYPTPTQSGPRHSPRTVNGTLADYTATGNMKFWEPAGATRRNFAYDTLGRLSSVSKNGATLAAFKYNADGLRVTTEHHVGARVTRTHILAEDFEWDETRGLARVHVMLGGSAIATVTSSWTGPSGAILPPLAQWQGWRGWPAWPAPLGESAALAALLLALLQLEALRRRGTPIARPALASLTILAFVTTTVVPPGAWAAATDGDPNGDYRLNGADVLRAMRIARGEVVASQADQDRLDVAPLGAAPQNPSRVDAADVVLLLRGASGADVDADGLSADLELAFGTSPFKGDSDGDGLGDGSEIAAGTDPAFADTDGDGLTDQADASPRSSVLYLFRDHLGSVVLVVREDRTIARRSLYSAYGKSDWNAATNPPLASSPSYIGTFGFTGQRYEPSVDLYDYNARWYEPKLAKFLQADAIVPEPYRPQSLNRYSYVTNDPVNRVDPTGNESVRQLCIEGFGCSGSSGSLGGPVVGNPDFRAAEFSYGGGSDSRGPGSLAGLIHPRRSGGTQASALTPRQLADQVWGSIEGAFAGGSQGLPGAEANTTSRRVPTAVVQTPGSSRRYPTAEAARSSAIQDVLAQDQEQLNKGEFFTEVNREGSNAYSYSALRYYACGKTTCGGSWPIVPGRTMWTVHSHPWTSKPSGPDWQTSVNAPGVLITPARDVLLYRRQGEQNLFLSR